MCCLLLFDGVCVLFNGVRCAMLLVVVVLGCIWLLFEVCGCLLCVVVFLCVVCCCALVVLFGVLVLLVLFGIVCLFLLFLIGGCLLLLVNC